MKTINYMLTLFIIFLYGCTNSHEKVSLTHPKEGKEDTVQESISATSKPAQDKTVQEENREVSGMPNPASKKCLEDGYTLEIVKSPEGVPTYGLCINPDTKRKCEEWKYFRGECLLDD
jgi:putative hemolysin